MPLTLITGPINSGKTTKLLSIFKDSLDDGGSPLYIVPNESIATELRKYFLTTESIALLGDLFISFPSFVKKLANVKKHILSSHQQTLLCHKLLLKQDLRYFSKSGISLGIAKEAADTIAALKRNLVDAQNLRNILETKGSLKEYDLLILYENYEKFLKDNNLFDMGDVYFKVVGAYCNTPLQNHIIIFDEFFMPEPGIIEILNILKKQLPETQIIISHSDSDNDLDLFANAVSVSINTLSKIADSHEKLTSKYSTESTPVTIVTSSPMEEARFILTEATGESDDENIETVIATRDNLFSSYFNSIGTPPLYPEIIDALKQTLPSTAHPSKFVEISKDVLRQKIDGANLKISLENSEDRIFAARTSSLLISLDKIMDSISTDASLLNIDSISKELFLEHVNQLINLNTFSDNISDIRLARYDHGTAIPSGKLFIPDAVEGKFPLRNRERIFFSEELLLDDIFLRTEGQLAKEAHLFKTWLSKAAFEVTLSYSQVSETGTEAIPSSFIAEFGKPIALDPIILEPSAAKNKNFISELNKKIEIEYARSAKSDTHLEYCGQIKSKEAKDLINKRYSRETFSASRLEKYAECPFQFFLAYTLRLEPKEDITREIKPNDRGTIIHTILENFYRNHLNTSENLEEVIERLANSAFEQHANLISQSSPILHPFQKKAIKQVALEAIKMELNERKNLPEPLSPFIYEWIFGAGDNAPLTIPIEGGKPANIQGRVDRIDVNENKSRFIIVDYKTGSKVESIAKNISEGKHLQLPIYVEAVRKMLMPSATPLGGILFTIMTAEKKHGFLKKEFNDICYSINKRSRTLMDDDKWNELLNTAIDYAAKYITKIRDGHFELTNDDCPHYCKFGDVCRAI